jgi:uncharacterized membrane protein
MLIMRQRVNTNTEKTIYIAMLIISIICILLSIIIQIEKKQYTQGQGGICSAITGSNGCETVQTSQYSSILGVDNPVYGIIGFSLLAVFSIIVIYSQMRLFKYLSALGSLVAGATASWFLYLQALVLHRYCVFCVIVDTFSLILLGLAVYSIYRLIHTSRHK